MLGRQMGTPWERKTDITGQKIIQNRTWERAKAGKTTPSGKLPGLLVFDSPLRPAQRIWRRQISKMTPKKTQTIATFVVSSS